MGEKIKREPCLPDVKTLIQAGFNPKTGLPYRLSNANIASKDDIKRVLRIIDEQDAVNRYVWYNLPCDLTSQELERMLYYKGQLAFFFLKEANKFYFMPYALDGTIDFYGRFNTIHPVPMTSGKDDDKHYKELSSTLSQIKLKCVYGIRSEDPDEDTFFNSAVLLHDYSKQLSQTIIPRQQLNDCIIDAMSECIPFMQTSLLLSTGIKGIRVSDADAAQNVDAAADSFKEAALKGVPYIPITAPIEMQDLTNGTPATSEEYMLAMQSLDNFRLSTYGIDNGGLFEKKTQELNAEAAINGGPVGLVSQDGLSIRQNFCNIVNSIWGLGIWCELAQNILGADIDGDGVDYERNEDGSQSGIEDGGAEDANEANV